MKKILGIVILGLLLSSNAYAASKFTYLSCPSMLKSNNNKGKFKDSELFKTGSYMGHFFYKFKDKKKELTKVTLYGQGNSIQPQDPDIWMNLPTYELAKANFLYTGDGYYYAAEIENVKWSWNISRDYDASGDDIWVLWTRVQTKNLDYWTSSNFYLNAKKFFDNNKFCEEVDKQEFNELIKKGIKKNTETKSNDDLTQQLMNLNELYKSGALTKEEFEKAKKKLLN